MKQAGATPSDAGDAVSGTVKTVLFVIPPILVSKFFPHGHHVLFGSSFIAGALLQALVPPRTYRFLWILGIATTAAIAIPAINYFTAW